jgi:choline-glycine betaine transporter
MIVISVISLPRFLEDPAYYIYMYGFILWPIYHIILVGMALSFFRDGKGEY